MPSGLQAIVAYYPGCQTFDPKNVRVPIQIFDGAADDITPVRALSGLCAGRNGCRKGRLDHDVSRRDPRLQLRGSGPSLLFGHPVRYDPDAAFAAGAATINFLHEYLGRTP